MRCRLVIKVTDVFYSPISGAKVEVFTAAVLNSPTSSAEFKVIAAREPGVHPTDELDIAEFEVNVSHPSFFSAHQKGRVQAAAGTPLPDAVFGAKNQLLSRNYPHTSSRLTVTMVRCRSLSYILRSAA